MFHWCEGVPRVLTCWVGVRASSLKRERSLTLYTVASKEQHVVYKLLCSCSMVRLRCKTFSGLQQSRWTCDGLSVAIGWTHGKHVEWERKVRKSRHHQLVWRATHISLWNDFEEVLGNQLKWLSTESQKSSEQGQSHLPSPPREAKGHQVY